MLVAAAGGLMKYLMIVFLYVRHTPEQQVCILNTTYKRQISADRIESRVCQETEGFPRLRHVRGIGDQSRRDCWRRSRKKSPYPASIWGLGWPRRSRCRAPAGAGRSPCVPRYPPFVPARFGAVPVPRSCGLVRFSVRRGDSRVARPGNAPLHAMRGAGCRRPIFTCCGGCVGCPLALSSPCQFARLSVHALPKCGNLSLPYSVSCRWETDWELTRLPGSPGGERGVDAGTERSSSSSRASSSSYASSSSGKNSGGDIGCKPMDGCEPIDDPRGDDSCDVQGNCPLRRRRAERPGRGRRQRADMTCCRPPCSDPNGVNGENQQQGEGQGQGTPCRAHGTAGRIDQHDGQHVKE